MPGGVRSMQGEKQMIYKNITFKAAPFSYDLTLMTGLLLLVEIAVQVKQYFMKCWKI